MPDAGGARRDITNNDVHAVPAGGECDCFLISGFATLSVGQFLWRSPGNHRIFKDARAPARDMSDLSKDIQLRLLQTAAVLKHQVLVIGLNRKRSDHALVRLSEKIDAHVKAQRIVFDNGRVDGGSQLVVLDCGWAAEICQYLQAIKGAV